MPPVPVSVRADDPATRSEISRELEALRGLEPAGAELVDDTRPRPRVVDPLVVTLAIALAAGVAGGAGKKIGELAITWLVERVRAIVQKRKTSVTMSVGGVSFTVDEHTVPADVAARVAGGTLNEPGT